MLSARGARALIVIIVVSLMVSSTAFARKASRDHFKRAASPHQSAPKTDLGGVPRHPDDVALDRKIESICRGC
jgi:predicted LPLAT superfamily acyltransferase